MQQSPEGCPTKFWEIRYLQFTKDSQTPLPPSAIFSLNFPKPNNTSIPYNTCDCIDASGAALQDTWSKEGRGKHVVFTGQGYFEYSRFLDMHHPN